MDLGVSTRAPSFLAPASWTPNWWCWFTAEMITQKEFPLPPLAAPSSKLWVSTKGDSFQHMGFRFTYTIFFWIVNTFVLAFYSACIITEKEKHVNAKFQGRRFRNVRISSNEKHYLRGKQKKREGNQSSTKICVLFTVHHLISYVEAKWMGWGFRLLDWKELQRIQFLLFSLK